MHQKQYAASRVQCVFQWVFLSAGLLLAAHSAVLAAEEQPAWDYDAVISADRICMPFADFKDRWDSRKTSSVPVWADGYTTNKSADYQNTYTHVLSQADMQVFVFEQEGLVCAAFVELKRGALVPKAFAPACELVARLFTPHWPQNVFSSSLENMGLYGLVPGESLEGRGGGVGFLQQSVSVGLRFENDGAVFSVSYFVEDARSRAQRLGKSSE